MLHTTIFQLVSIWAELEAAMRGEHHYGGHTMELYAYRLTERNPFIESGNTRLANPDKQTKTFIVLKIS